jgi:hypothetical protein
MAGNFLHGFGPSTEFRTSVLGYHQWGEGLLANPGFDGTSHSAFAVLCVQIKRELKL